MNPDDESQQAVEAAEQIARQEQRFTEKLRSTMRLGKLVAEYYSELRSRGVPEEVASELAAHYSTMAWLGVAAFRD